MRRENAIPCVIASAAKQIQSEVRPWIASSLTLRAMTMAHMSAREITMRHRTENDSIKQRHGAGPAGRAAFHFVREAGDDEAVIGKLFQIAQFLHMAIGDLAAGFVAFPDDRRVMGFEPALASMHERGVPAPGVDAGDAHAARGQIKRGLAAHAAAGGEVLIAADAARSAGVVENDVEWLELMADAFEFGVDLGGRDHMAVRNFTEIELDAGTEEPVERHLIDGHHRLAIDRLRLE